MFHKVFPRYKYSQRGGRANIARVKLESSKTNGFVQQSAGHNGVEM